MPNTPLIGAPYPSLNSTPNGPVQIMNTALHIEEYSIMRFPTATDRDTALPTPDAGMVAHVADSGMWRYSGTEWVRMVDDTISATPRTYTPVLTATVTNPSVGSGAIVNGYYYTLGPVVAIEIRITLGSSPTAGSGAYAISLPVPALGFGALSGYYQGAASSNRVSLTGRVVGSSMDRGLVGEAGKGFWGNTVYPLTAQGDLIVFSGTYMRA